MGAEGPVIRHAATGGVLPPLHGMQPGQPPDAGGGARQRFELLPAPDRHCAGLLRTLPARVLHIRGAELPDRAPPLPHRLSLPSALAAAPGSGPLREAWRAVRGAVVVASGAA